MRLYSFTFLTPLIILAFLGAEARVPALALMRTTTTINVVKQTTPTTTARSAKRIASPGLFVVSRVIDGDTIELATGEKIRYIGIDTPETVHPKKAVQCFGKEASNYNRQLVEGKKVRLQKDVSETDKYGRLLRYVYLSDGTFVNLKLVKEGFATAATFPPDVAHAAEFRSAAAVARAAKRGLWGKCR